MQNVDIILKSSQSVCKSIDQLNIALENYSQSQAKRQHLVISEATMALRRDLYNTNTATARKNNTSCVSAVEDSQKRKEEEPLRAELQDVSVAKDYYVSDAIKIAEIERETAKEKNLFERDYGKELVETSRLKILVYLALGTAFLFISAFGSTETNISLKIPSLP